MPLNISKNLIRVSQVGVGVKRGRRSETLRGNMTLELKLQLEDAGPEDLVGKNILDRMRQNRNELYLIWETSSAEA